MSAVGFVWVDGWVETGQAIHVGGWVGGWESYVQATRRLPHCMT